MKRFLRGILGTALPLVEVVSGVVQAAAPVATAPAAVSVTIDTDAPAHAYSPLIFGGFVEHFDDQIYGGLFEPGSPLSDERGFRSDVIDALKELKLSVVRWPGGCFASGYHWRDGVGKNRKPVADPVWGVTEPNTFGTDEFIEWCRLVGCEPYICTNAGNGTPEEMKQWVEYCNADQGEFADLRRANGHEKPFGVKYWSIGNENYGYWEIGRKTPETWGPLVHRCAGLMRSVDSSIKLSAAAWLDKREWDMPLLAAAGHDLDFLAVHSYWINTSKPMPFQNIVSGNGPERTITSVVGLVEEAGFRGKIKIAYDEWNLRHWHHPGFPRKSPVDPGDEKAAEHVAMRKANAEAAQYSMADALFSALFFHACLRHCEDVGMANIAPIVNTRGPLYVHPKGIVRRTTFHALAMYANLLESRVGQLTVRGSTSGGGKEPQPVVDAVATVDAAGKRWVISMVNRLPAETVACTVRLGDHAVDGTFEATVLVGDSSEAYNDVEHPDRVVPEKVRLEFKQGLVSLPPHSLTIVRVDSR